MWLLLRYATALAWAGLLLAGCLAAGHRISTRMLGLTLRFEEQVSVAAALGVVAYFLLAFGAGILGLYGKGFFFAAPLVLLAVGGAPAGRYVKKLVRRAKGVRFRLGPFQGVVLVLGLTALALVWLPTLYPENPSVDARWYHLPIAEQYIAEGGIKPFREGWVEGAYPQLGSLLYVWALLAPGALFDRLQVAAQLEVLLLITTLVGVSACVRRMTGARAPLGWAALFLFPGIFCYDSGLVLGAEHIAALFAPPLLLLTLKLRERPSVGVGVLLGACAAGALDTKYTAILLLPLPVFGAVRALLVAARENRRSIWQTAAAFALTAFALTAPHWLKNALYYGDPLFPRLSRWLPAHPWAAFMDAPFQASNWLARPTSFGTGMVEMARTLATFSFVPHDFRQFHGSTPVFGSLFTLATPLVGFAKRRGPVLLVFAATYAGVALWFWTHAFDRYLQVLVPWMATGVAAVLAGLWQRDLRVRSACVLVVGLQIAWGAGVPFIPSHRAAGGSVLRSLVTWLGQDAAKRPGVFGEWPELGAAAPRGARVLLHEGDVRAGFGAAVVTDYPGDQGALYWGEPGAATPREIWSKLRGLGVTHVLWSERRDVELSTVGGALAFFDFVSHHVHVIKRVHGYALAELAAEPPPPSSSGNVAYYACHDRAPFSQGLYPLLALARFPGDSRPIAKPAPVAREQALESADYLVYDASCQGPLPEATRREFELMAARGSSMLMRRRQLAAR